MRGNLEISELLFSKGANLNARDEIGDQSTILMYAVRNGNEKFVKWLIAKGAEVNAIDNNKQLQISLHLAARENSNAEVVKILIEKGANINALNDYE